MRSILNFFLTLLFTRIIFKNKKTKTGEKILYEIKDAINNFYLNEILKEQKNFTDDRIIKLYTANYQYTYKSLINSKYFNNQIISS